LGKIPPCCPSTSVCSPLQAQPIKQIRSLPDLFIVGCWIEPLSRLRRRSPNRQAAASMPTKRAASSCSLCVCVCVCSHTAWLTLTSCFLEFCTTLQWLSCSSVMLSPGPLRRSVPCGVRAIVTFVPSCCASDVFTHSKLAG
jgi:hypothetical protein